MRLFFYYMGRQETGASIHSTSVNDCKFPADITCIKLDAVKRHRVRKGEDMMNTTFDVSYRTKSMRTFLKAYDVKSSQNPDQAFLRKMAEIAAKENEAQADGTEKAGEPVRILSKDMSMEEYKKYLYDRISQIPVHPSNMQDYVSVQISESGLEAMKNDAEYEQWVLDSIKSNFMARDPYSGMCGGKYVVLYFGDSKEQSRFESWRAGFPNGSGDKLPGQKPESSFWERRMRRRKELREQYEKILEIKELNKDLSQGFYYGELAILSALKPQSDGSQKG